MNEYDLTNSPKLRWPLDLQQVKDGDELFLVIRDPEALAERPLVLPWACQAILSRFNGSYSLAEILQEGEPWGLTEQILAQLTELLDSVFLLESPASARRMADIQLEFSASPIRAASHAGEVYPEEPEILRQVLDQYIAITETAGSIAPPTDREGRIVALISPHIDYARGWHTYGKSYHILRHVPVPDIIFLIGTSHQPGKSLFQLTAKHFATPLGTLPNESEIVARLSAAYGIERSFRDEMLHRKEHSLELQLPWIAHCYGNDHLPQIVPILVGSFHQLFQRGRHPIEEPEVADFVGALAEILRDCRTSGRSILFYGGVDLSHMGQYFGDEQRVFDEGLSEIERRDRQLLESVLAGREDALYEHMEEDLDRRRICGYPTIYTMLAALRRGGYGLSGHPVEYRQAADSDSDCIVTFASAYWREQPALL